MRALPWLLLCLIILQCIFIALGQDEDGEDDSDFAILDELEAMEEGGGCDGSCKAPGRDKTKKKMNKNKKPKREPPKKKSPQEKQQEIQQMMTQYQHYLQYMQENGNGEEPLSPQEFMEYMNYMKQGQAAGLTPEEIQAKYAQEMQQKAMQSPEVQEQLKNDLPDLNAKYKDLAYLGIADIPPDILNLDKIFGCGVVKIPKGTFYMGSEHDENYEEDGEAPYRKIKISKSFYMDACEVTNAQFLQFWNETKMKGISKYPIFNTFTKQNKTKQSLSIISILSTLPTLSIITNHRQNRSRKVWMVICI